MNDPIVVMDGTWYRAKSLYDTLLLLQQGEFYHVVDGFTGFVVIESDYYSVRQKAKHFKSFSWKIINDVYHMQSGKLSWRIAPKLRYSFITDVTYDQELLLGAHYPSQTQLYDFVTIEKKRYTITRIEKEKNRYRRGYTYTAYGTSVLSSKKVKSLYG